MNVRGFVNIIIIAAACMVAAARTSHQSYLNQFADFPNASVVDNRMVVNNPIASPEIVIDTIWVDSYKFHILTRMANKHNGENKSYKAKYDNNKSLRITNPRWGIVFNYIDNDNYCAVVLQCATSSYLDVTEHRDMHCSLIKVCGGMETIVATTTINDNVDFYEGDNLLSVEHSDGNTVVKIGRKTLREVFSTRNIEYADRFMSGIYAGAASSLSVERFVTKSENNPAAALTTEWTIESLNKRFASSADPMEGYWQYLDREMEEKKVKLGGRYEIAVVKNSSEGYDILYVSGAVVNSRNWHACMLKGKLIKTGFIDEYDMVWYDSDMRYMPHDLSVSIENGSILTLRFPTLNSQIRFSRKR